MVSGCDTVAYRHADPPQIMIEHVIAAPPRLARLAGVIGGICHEEGMRAHEITATVRAKRFAGAN